MTVIPPWDDTKLPAFYRSAPTPCPYLKGRLEQKLFTQASGPKATFFNSLLTANGFRRSHDIIYRPDCPGCNACVAVRIPVDKFKPNRNQRRLIRYNAGLEHEICDSTPDEDQYDMFMRYQQARHGDSEMARMTYDDFTAMMVEGNVDIANLRLFEPKTGKPMGTMLFDPLMDGVSAVYSFFDPDVPGKYSLGSTLVLRLIDYTRERDMPYLYLGYWIRQCEKMNYKSRFSGLEGLTENGWVDFETHFEQDS